MHRIIKILFYHLLVIIPLGISGISHWMSMIPSSSTMTTLRGGLDTIIKKIEVILIVLNTHAHISLG